MTSGKWMVMAIVGLTALFAITLWYFQTRAFYAPISLAEADIHLTLEDGSVVPMDVTAFQGIDADTSPLRFRACFTVSLEDVGDLAEHAAPHPDPAPLIAPRWFDCYDADQIGGDLEMTLAVGLVSEVEVARGVDRVVALYPDGRGFAWHQLNGTLE